MAKRRPARDSEAAADVEPDTPPVVLPPAATAPPVAPPEKRVFNCIRSVEHPEDVVFNQAAALEPQWSDVSDQMDYRRDEWPVSDQGKTGACVGFAVADGLLRWHLAEVEKKIGIAEKLSTRFIWMAAKELDEWAKWPTTFLDVAGTSIRSALDVAHRFGCVKEIDLHLGEASLALDDEAFFFRLAAQLQVASCTPIEIEPDLVRRWLGRQGPIVGRLLVDQSFWQASQQPELKQFISLPGDAVGHAVMLVGYTSPDRFIIRNSWGQAWGDNGFAYASAAYLQTAFSELFGIYR